VIVQLLTIHIVTKRGISPNSKASVRIQFSIDMNHEKSSTMSDDSTTITRYEMLIGPEAAFPPKKVLSTCPTEFGLRSSQRIIHGSKFMTPIYTKNIKWSPDGLVLLSNSSDNILRLFELEQQLFTIEEIVPNENEIETWKSCLRVRETGPIYDFDWYPLMNSHSPSTCFFISASCSQPVQMWDAFNGQMLHSYECLNHVNELVTPISISFNASGSKIFCGLNRAIKVFDTEYPGSDSGEVICCEKINKKYYGQTSLISCFAFTRPQISKTIFAAGCYDNTIGLYDERVDELVQLLEGHTKGVTCIKFSPCANFLYSACRTSGEIFCWDLRNTTEPVLLFKMQRNVSTNVKVTFDIDPFGKYLITGNDNGKFSIFDLATGTKIDDYDTGKRDCINSATFHPYLPYIAVSNGERVYTLDIDSDEENKPEQEVVDYASVSLFNVSCRARVFSV
jgi:WD40 repeat protein